MTSSEPTTHANPAMVHLLLMDRMGSMVTDKHGVTWMLAHVDTNGCVWENEGERTERVSHLRSWQALERARRNQ